jgi:hypothetical protein
MKSKISNIKKSYKKTGGIGVKIFCKYCDEQLSYTNINTRSVDFSGKRIRGCRDCAEKEQVKMQDKYFIEEYNGNKIYCIDGNYIPYWGCGYYFKTLEDCKIRMDSKVAVFDPMGFALMNSLLK